MNAREILSSNDPRKIFNVPKNATQEKINAAYHKLAISFHPDKEKDPETKALHHGVMAKLNDFRDALISLSRANATEVVNQKISKRSAKLKRFINLYARFAEGEFLKGDEGFLKWNRKSDEFYLATCLLWVEANLKNQYDDIYSLIKSALGYQRANLYDVYRFMLAINGWYFDETSYQKIQLMNSLHEKKQIYLSEKIGFEIPFDQCILMLKNLMDNQPNASVILHNLTFSGPSTGPSKSTAVVIYKQRNGEIYYFNPDSFNARLDGIPSCDWYPIEKYILSEFYSNDSSEPQMLTIMNLSNENEPTSYFESFFNVECKVKTRLQSLYETGDVATFHSFVPNHRVNIAALPLQEYLNQAIETNNIPYALGICLIDDPGQSTLSHYYINYYILSGGSLTTLPLLQDAFKYYGINIIELIEPSLLQSDDTWFKDIYNHIKNGSIKSSSQLQEIFSLGFILTDTQRIGLLSAIAENINAITSRLKVHVPDNEFEKKTAKRDYQKWIDFIELLIQHGYSLHSQKKYSVSELLYVALYNAGEFIPEMRDLGKRYLERHILNINDVDRNGFQAIHYIAKKNDRQEARYLIHHGANINKSKQAKKVHALFLFSKTKGDEPKPEDSKLDSKSKSTKSNNNKPG